ncbi:MAG: hypothetical protein KKF36_15630 [Alphaproteobacteria bacterium]|nr:hypothetical protein [Alphaproteobacteria bacterium]
MHLTQKDETTKLAAAIHLRQQDRFDRFIQEFNGEGPHDALAMACPATVFTPSPAPLQQPV